MPTWLDRLRREMGADSDDFDDATTGPDTDFDDTFRYEHPDGPTEPAKGKRWLGGRCSIWCGDRECPPCMREEQSEADRLPPASFPWLNGLPPEPPVGTVLETSDHLDTYRIERTDLGWHIQYREGESEFGERLTSFAGRGISWESAWRAWGPPAGSEPFRDIPPGTPPLPPRPAEPQNGLATADASDGHLDPPPAAQPYRPPAKPGTTSSARTAPTATSGATMTSADTYSGLRGRLTGVASRAPERQGPLQQALAGVEEDIAELSTIGDDTSQPGIQEALGSLQRAKEAIEEANWMVGAAQASTEGAAAALQ